MYTNAVVPGTPKPTIFLMDGNADFQPFYLYTNVESSSNWNQPLKKVDGFRVPGTYGCFVKWWYPQNTQNDHF